MKIVKDPSLTSGDIDYCLTLLDRYAIGEEIEAVPGVMESAFLIPLEGVNPRITKGGTPDGRRLRGDSPPSASGGPQ